MGMSSVFGVVKSYLSTLRNQRTQGVNLGAIVLQFGVPIVAGVFWFLICPPISNTSNAIVGISIVSALLCAMATMLFQTRVSLRSAEAPEVNYFVTNKDLKLVDELFYAVLWAILFGLITVLLMIVSEWIETLWQDDFISKCASAIVVVLCAHFVFLIGTILKRLARVYDLIAAQKR